MNHGDFTALVVVDQTKCSLEEFLVGCTDKLPVQFLVVDSVDYSMAAIELVRAAIELVQAAG